MKETCCVWVAAKAGLGERTRGAKGAEEAAAGAGERKPGKEAEATERVGEARVATQERAEGNKKGLDCATER